MFYGFAIERLEVCFLHGVLVAFPIVRLARGELFWPGAVAGVALHFVINFPIYPAQIDVFGLGGPAWSIVVMGWVAVWVVAGAIMLWRLHRRLLHGPG